MKGLFSGAQMGVSFNALYILAGGGGKVASGDLRLEDPDRHLAQLSWM
jgi:hypothetical protein